MTIRHNYYVFFTASYVAFLAIGLGLGFVLGSATGWNIGYVVNVLSFAAALKVATANSDVWFLKILAPPRYFFYSELREKLKTHSIVSALLATAIDSSSYFVASHYFSGAFQALSPGRLLVLVFAYSVLAYLLLDILTKQGTSLNRDESEAAQCFVEGFRVLGDGDKSVLIAGLKLPGSPMITTSGSPNDIFWRDLSRHRLTERAELSEGIQASEVSKNLVAWTLTEEGSRLITFLLHSAGKSTAGVSSDRNR